MADGFIKTDGDSEFCWRPWSMSSRKRLRIRNAEPRCIETRRDIFTSQTQVNILKLFRDVISLRLAARFSF